MSEDIEAVISHIYGNTNPEEAEQANEVINQFISSVEGFQWCITKFGNFQNVKTDCFALSVIKDWIQNHWEEANANLQQICSILFEAAPSLVESREPLFTTTLSSTLTKLFFHVYPEIIPDFFAKICAFPTSLISSFFVDFTSSILETTDYEQIKKQMDSDQSSEAIVSFFETKIMESDFSILLPLYHVLSKLKHFINIEPYQFIIDNIPSFDANVMNNALSVVRLVISDMEKQQAAEFITATNLIQIAADIASSITDEKVLLAIGKLLEAIIDKCSYITINDFTCSRNAAEAGLHSETFLIDVEPIYAIAVQFLFPSQYDIVSKSTFATIETIVGVSPELIPDLLTPIMERLIADCANNSDTTDFTNCFLKFAGNILKLVPNETTNEFFNAMKDATPSDESVFPFAAALFKLLYVAKNLFIAIENIVEIIDAFSGILEVEQPLSSQQMNALSSYESFFLCSYSLFDSAACQAAIDALLKNITGEEEECSDQIYKLITNFFNDAQFMKNVTIPQEYLLQLATCGDTRLTEFVGKYISHNKEAYTELYQHIIEEIIQDLSDQGIISAAALFIESCNSSPNFIPIAFEACQRLAEAASSDDYLFSIVIKSAAAALGERIQEFVEGKEPIGTDSAAAICFAASKCDTEFCASVLEAIAPLLVETLGEITDCVYESDEFKSANEFHKQFFLSAERCARSSKIVDAALSLALTIRERGNIVSFVLSELNFLILLPPMPEIIEYLITFSEVPNFSKTGMWRLVMRTASSYLCRAINLNNEAYLAAIAACGEKGEKINQALFSGGKRMEANFQEACISIHNDALPQ